MADSVLFITSRNYSSWSLRGWLLCRIAGLKFRAESISPDDPRVKEELLMRASSIRYPALVHGDVKVWDTLGMAEYLNEAFPEAGLLPQERQARALCRSISGEMHSGFSALRASLPMNIRARRPGFRIWTGPRADIAAVNAIWEDCIARSGGPFLFGVRPTIADAMFAPVVSRYVTYDVPIEGACRMFADAVLGWDAMIDWMRDAEAEPEEIAELDIEF
ncbi:MAG: glutathione S-transferase [Pseudomonadota bacterium]